VLFILIPLAWLTIVALFIAICESASRGDTEPVQVIEAPSHSPRPGLVVWEQSPVSALVRRPRRQGGSRVRSRQLAGHASR
jgi:hypothetical protein